mgnify:CR=1 FL=1
MASAATEAQPSVPAQPSVVGGSSWVAPIREAGELAIFCVQALIATPRALRYFAEVLRQTALMMRGTLLLVFTMNVFLGITVGNFAFFTLRSIGASDFMGLVSGYGAPRQLGVTMFGYVFTAKVCCAMAAELGAMRIQQEVDAYSSTGVDPIRYLVGTRLIAVVLFVPVAAFASLVGHIAGVYVMSVILLQGLPGGTLMSVHWAVQSLADQIFAISVMLGIAVSTALVACFYGLRTRGGPAAVGSSVARSLVVNLVLLHVVAVVFAMFVYGPDLKLPIGG